MIKAQNKQIYKNILCAIHNQEWLEKQIIAGKVVSQALSFLKNEACNTDGLSLSRKVEEFILDNKCTPTFKGYKGFPEAVCISVNNELVHGIPKNISFKDGDVVSFDLGATYDGVIADSAITIIIGENKKAEKLVRLTKESLDLAISNIKIGLKLGIIGEVINRVAKNNNIQVIDKYGGHFIGYNEPHASPFVSNKDTSSNGIRFQEGMSLAIEPLFCLGLSNNTKTLSDGWTVVTNDISAHFEHTIYISKDKTIIITE